MEEEDKKLHLDETQLHYELFLLNPSGTDIESFYQEILALIELKTRAYIWNNEKFTLKKPSSTDDPEIGHVCQGLLDFGDNLEDEWFLVTLLFEITARFANLAARIVDADGEFLLIQVANSLPDWASSDENDCMRNRVFIHKGRLHIIPPATNPSMVTFMPGHGPLKTSSLNAAKLVFKFPNITQASELVQEAIGQKLAQFSSPGSYLHRVSCCVPVKLAYLLKNNPSLISSAVNTFCQNDPNDMKLLQKSLDVFKPVDFVAYRVLFTKHLYGKLKHFEFLKKLNWPSMNDIVSQMGTNEASKLTKDKFSIGFKLTCAFELLARKIDLKMKSSPSDNEDTACSFDKYISRLANYGYFKDYMENSKNYNELMDQAKKSFQTGSAHQMKSSSLMEDFDMLHENDVAKLKEEIRAASADATDDNDDWLFVEAPQLDDYLEMYSKGDVSSTYDFKILSQTMRGFMGKTGKTETGVDNKGDAFVNLNVDLIEENLKELLSNPPLKQEDEGEEEKEDENDSFYEVDDDNDEDVDDKSTDKLKDYMSLMDEEIKGEKNLSRLNNPAAAAARPTDLDIDINLVTNALESYSTQMGLTGPVSNILKSLGL
jgi:hypothetical protein